MGKIQKQQNSLVEGPAMNHTRTRKKPVSLLPVMQRNYR